MDISSGNFGAGGARNCSVKLIFSGVLGEAFIAFALRRASWLGLRGWVESNTPAEVAIYAEGPEVLVGALEVSCSLGPIESTVECWSCVECEDNLRFTPSEGERQIFGIT